MTERTAGHGAARAEQRPSSVLELVGSDRAMSTVLSFLGPALPMMEENDEDCDRGQSSGGRLREALALGRLLPGVCVANPIKVGLAGAALLATDACLGGLQVASGSSFAHVLDALKLNTGLRKLDLQRGALNAGEVALLCGALAVNVSLFEVNVWTHFSFGRPGARAMAAALSATTSLQKLSLSSCKIRPGDVALLAVALAANASLRELDLGHNNVGEAGGRALAAVLETNSTLHVLGLRDTHLGDAGGRAIGAALATNNGLFQLDLGDNELGEASGRAMAAALPTNSTLRVLNLFSNEDFGGNGAVALFDALRSNHTLLELRLDSTELDHASGVALADMVRENSTLGVLDLSFNRLSRAEDGSRSCSWAQVLAALKDNIGLHTLCLQSCGLSVDDGQALAEALDQRRSRLLQVLQIRANPGIGDRACGAIIAACLRPGSSVASTEGLLQRNADQDVMHSLAEGLRQENMLEVLDVHGFKLSGAETTELFAALAVNTRVHTLLLRDCGLTAVDGQALASALEQRPDGTLRELNVRNNSELGDDACSAIIAACLKPDSALKKLNIGNSGAGLAVTLSLAGCLRANHTLEELRLANMGAESNWSELFGALAANSGLRTLNIRECVLKQLGVEALAAALQTNRVMHDLYVTGEELGDDCGEIMAEGLATNTTLRRLHLGGRPSSLGEATANAFRALLQTNSTLRELSLSSTCAASDSEAEALKQAGRAKGCQVTLPVFPVVFPCISRFSAFGSIFDGARWTTTSSSHRYPGHAVGPN